MADFLDTNVIVYMLDQSAPAKRAVAEEIVASAVAGRAAVISSQVVQETLTAVARKFATPLDVADRRTLLRRVLVPLWTINPTHALFERALGIQERFAYQFYDAMIVAAAAEGGCERLLSEDLQDGHVVDGVVIENPFRGLQAGT
jgi:predicted nucleic acid-binding protein